MVMKRMMVMMAVAVAAVVVVLLGPRSQCFRVQDSGAQCLCGISPSSQGVVVLLSNQAKLVVFIMS